MSCIQCVAGGWKKSSLRFEKSITGCMHFNGCNNSRSDINTGSLFFSNSCHEFCMHHIRTYYTTVKKNKVTDGYESQPFMPLCYFSKYCYMKRKSNHASTCENISIQGLVVFAVCFSFIWFYSSFVYELMSFFVVCINIYSRSANSPLY